MEAELEPQVVSEDPHADENPEEYMGAEILDPWADPEQLDWPNNDESGEE